MDIKTLTHTGTIAQQNFEDYSESFAALGHILMDIPILHQLPHFLAQLLPNDYTAVSLGSGDGKQTTAIAEVCQKEGKNGKFISVDPFITRQNVLKITSEEFMDDCKDHSLDLVLCKFSFHFNKDQQTFFKNVYRCLKPSGKMVITQVRKDSALPWTKCLQQNFVKLYLDAEDCIPSELFKWELRTDSKNIKLDKGMFRDFVSHRGWSNLLTHSQAQIDECVDYLNSIEELPEAVMGINLFLIEKKA